MPNSKATRITAIAAIVAMAAVLVGLSLVQVFSSGDSGADTVAKSPRRTTALVECNPPPALPGSPQTFDTVPAKASAQGAQWEATVTTNCGDIVVALDGAKAPQTVASFLFLARQDYYQDSPCHRLVRLGIFVLQCGDPTGTGSGGPGYGYGIENAPKDGSYPRGTLAMARTDDPNSNGSQFFIVFKDTVLPVEGGGYSIFGKVVSGMGIVDAIVSSGVGGSLGPEAPKQPISILGVTVKKLA